MSATSTGRRKGSQPGNTNRLRHGLYSKRLLSPESAAPSYESQLTLYRRRLAQLLTKQEHASIPDYLSYERGILHYIALILELRRSGLADTALAPADLITGDGHPSFPMIDAIEPPTHNLFASFLASLNAIRTSRRSLRNSADSLSESNIRTSNCSS